MSTNKLNEKKIRTPYPRDGDTDHLRVDAGYTEDPEDNRKFLLKTAERTISIWESQLDALVLIARGTKEKTLTVYWQQLPNSKTIMPVIPMSE